MYLKKRNLLLTFFLIIIIQILIYTNNNQKTSFRYFIWNLQQVHVGKLISISFFSGLLISIFLNNTKNTGYKNNKNISDKNDEIFDTQIDNEVNDEVFDTQNDNEVNDANLEIPPQRDLREAQPTISVNYRVIKNNELKNEKYKQKTSNNSDSQDDWINDDIDW